MARRRRSRLTPGEVRLYERFLENPHPTIKGHFEPLTPTVAHQLAPGVVPGPPVPPGVTVNRYGAVTGGALGAPPSLQYRTNPVLAATGVVDNAGTGVTGAPPAVTQALRETGLLDQVEKLRQRRVAASEPIHPDVLAESLGQLAITTALTAGLGDPAVLGSTAAKTAASAGAGAAEETAGRSAAQILADAAQSVRQAPQAARQAVESLGTRAGQRAAAQRAAGGAASYALEHPKLAQVGGLGVVGAATGKREGGLQVPSALIQGSFQAVNPFASEGGFGANTWNTAEATARGIEGAVVAPLALGYSAIDSAVHGTPAPFLSTAGAQLEGLGQIGSNLLSGNPDTVRKATEEEVGLSLLPLLPRLGDTALAHAGAAALRDRVNELRGGINRRFGTNLRYGPDQGLTSFRTNQRLRRDVSEEGTRYVAPEENVAHHQAAEVTRAGRRIPGAADLGTLRRGDLPAEDLIATLAETGLRHEKGIPLLREKFPRNPEAGAREVTLNRVLDYVEKDPGILRDPNMLAAIEAYRDVQSRSPEHARGADRRARLLTQAHAFGVPDAVEMIPKGVEALLPKKQPYERPWTRTQAWHYLEAGEHTLTDLKRRTRDAVTNARVLGARVQEIERDERRRQRAAGARVVRTDEPRRSDLPRGHGEVVRPAVKTRGADRGGRRLPESRRLQSEKAKLVDAQAQARGLRAETKELGRHLEAIRKGSDGEPGLNDLQRPWNAVSSRARRLLWTDEMLEEMERRVALARAGHDGAFEEPVFTAHQEPIDAAPTSTGARGFNSSATEVPKIRAHPARLDAETGDVVSLAGRDAVDRTFAALIQHSIEGPARTRGLKAFTRHVFEKYPITLDVRRGDRVDRTVRLTRQEWNRQVADGKISAKGHIWVPESDYKQVMLEAPETSSELARLVHHGERTNEKGSYGVVLPEAVANEHKFQVSPTHDKFTQAADKFASTIGTGMQRFLLLSPAWIEAQSVAELLPMLMANPELLVKAPKIWSEIRKAGHQDPDALRAWGSVAGEGPIRTQTAQQFSPGYQPRTHAMFSDAAKAMEHSLPGRVMLSVVKLKPFAIFDQWRSGEYAKVWAAARLDKELNSWLGSLQRMITKQRLVSDSVRQELKGRPIHEVIEELGSNPRYAKALDSIYEDMNKVRGNWRSFTSWERKFAPLSVFYGFLRYALRWPLHFARKHPLAASVNYFLAQANAEEMEKILHGKPSSFFKFADPVVYGADGEASVLPGGTRVSATGSPLLEGLGEGNAAQSVVGATNPAIATLLGLITGTDNFGGHDEDEGFLGLHWSLATKELLAGTPLSRYLGIGASHSQTAEELLENDPHRKARSFYDVFAPQSAESFKNENDIINSIQEYEDAKKANGGFPPSSSSSSTVWGSGGGSSSSNVWGGSSGASSSNVWAGG